jgi:tetratricopeptide (TPR) repeat protein
LAAVTDTLVDNGDALARSGRVDDAIACYDQVINLYCKVNDPVLQKQVRIALRKKGSLLVHIGRYDEADIVFTAWRARLGDVETPERTQLRTQDALAQAFYARVYALVGKGQYDLAVSAADALLERLTVDSVLPRPVLIVNAMRVKAYALAEGGRMEDATVLLGELATHYSNLQDPIVQKALAKALIKRGDLADKGGHDALALEVYGDLVTRFGDSYDLEMQEAVAAALRGKSSVLQRLGNYEESLAIEDDVLARFGGSPLRSLRYVVVDALAGKAWDLQKLDRSREAIGVCDELIQRYGDESELRVRERVAYTLDFKAGISLNKGCNEDTITTIDELVSCFGHATELEICCHVANGLVKKAFALGSLSRLDEVVTVADDTSKRFGDSTEKELKMAVGQLLDLKALALRKLGELEQAVAVWSEVAERYWGDEMPQMRNLVQHALTQKAEVLTMLGRRDEAIVVADGLIDGGGEKTNSEDADPRELFRVADALIVKGSALSVEGHYEEAIETFDRLIDRFKNAQEPRLRRSMAIALNGKIAALDRLDREEESDAAFDQLASNYGGEALVMLDETARRLLIATGPESREAAASLLCSKAHVLGKLGRNDEALLTLDELIARFEEDESPGVRDIVSQARADRERTLDEDGGLA